MKNRHEYGFVLRCWRRRALTALALCFAIMPSLLFADGNGDDMQALGECPSTGNSATLTLPARTGEAFSAYSQAEAYKICESFVANTLDVDNDGDYVVGCEKCPSGTTGTDGGGYCTVKKFAVKYSDGGAYMVSPPKGEWGHMKFTPGLYKCKVKANPTVTWDCQACVACDSGQ